MMRKFLNPLLDLVYPKKCPGCHIPSISICVNCKTLWQNPPVTIVLNQNKVPVISVAQYRNEVRAVLLAYKENGELESEKVLTEALLRARLEIARDSICTLVPIPSNPKSIRRRGRDFMMELCTQVSIQSGDKVLPILRVNRNVDDQSKLNEKQRSQNLIGAFGCISKNLHLAVTSPIILVDDLLTTGATLREAVRALGHHGISPIGAITAAHTGLSRHK
jgi:ComF family protein